MSGYVDCACRDCFDVAIASANEGQEAFCSDCEDAGCDEAHVVSRGPGECLRDDAYGADSLCEHGSWVCSEKGCENNAER